MDKIKNDLQGTSKEIEKIGSPIKLRKIESKKNSVIQNVTFIRPQINNVTIISNSIERDAYTTKGERCIGNINYSPNNREPTASILLKRRLETSCSPKEKKKPQHHRPKCNVALKTSFNRELLNKSCDVGKEVKPICHKKMPSYNIHTKKYRTLSKQYE